LGFSGFEVLGATTAGCVVAFDVVAFGVTDGCEVLGATTAGCVVAFGVVVFGVTDGCVSPPTWLLG